MADRGILFSAPMVLAILSGAKTVTRRLCGGVPNGFDQPIVCDDRKVAWRCDGGTMRLRKPLAPALAGDRLWVREAWRVGASWDTDAPAQIGLHLDDARAAMIGGTTPTLYLADGTIMHPRADATTWGRYRHARFMPRWASRITLLVESVRVERMADVTDDDAIREGIQRLPTGAYGIPGHHMGKRGEGFIDARGAYFMLWDAINGPGSSTRGGLAGPWVWRVEFRRSA